MISHTFHHQNIIVLGWSRQIWCCNKLFLKSDNNSDRINGNKKTVAALRQKKIKKRQQSRMISDDENLQKEKRVFKTSL
jgi:hypothetical protein